MGELPIASKSFPVTVTVIRHTVTHMLSTFQCGAADGMPHRSSVINFVAGKSRLLSVNPKKTTYFYDFKQLQFVMVNPEHEIIYFVLYIPSFIRAFQYIKMQ